MDVPSAIRKASLAAVLGVSLALGMGAIFVSGIRERFVFSPAERGVEEALRTIADRERALLETRGEFAPFADPDVQRDGALLSLPWNTFPAREFSFDAVTLDSGRLRLRALPRADAVASLSVPARFYLAELSPAGEVVRAGWYPAPD